jgi:hypothetical protein
MNPDIHCCTRVDDSRLGGHVNGTEANSVGSGGAFTRPTRGRDRHARYAGIVPDLARPLDVRVPSNAVRTSHLISNLMVSVREIYPDVDGQVRT